jgi:hypothetical protein
MHAYCYFKNILKKSLNPEGVRVIKMKIGNMNNCATLKNGIINKEKGNILFF